MELQSNVRPKFSAQGLAKRVVKEMLESGEFAWNDKLWAKKIEAAILESKGKSCK